MAPEKKGRHGSAEEQDARDQMHEDKVALIERCRGGFDECGPHGAASTCDGQCFRHAFPCSSRSPLRKLNARGEQRRQETPQHSDSEEAAKLKRHALY